MMTSSCTSKTTTSRHIAQGLITQVVRERIRQLPEVRCTNCPALTRFPDDYGLCPNCQGLKLEQNGHLPPGAWSRLKEATRDA